MTDFNRKELFEKMPVHMAVIRQITPAVIAQMIALIYNLADTFYVGLLNDPRQTAAVTVSYSPFMMLNVISNLFGIGGASAISRALGRKEWDSPGNISAASIWMSGLCSAIYALVFYSLRVPILNACGASPANYTLCEGYAIWVVLLGGIPSVLNQVLANLIRSDGNARVAAVGTSIGGLINIILDPFFILPRYLNLGAIGAGMATAFSNLISAVFLIAFLITRAKSTVLSMSPYRIKEGITRISEVLAGGIPSAIQIGLTVISVTAMAKFVSLYGIAPVAALGIVKKLDQLPLFFAIGVANGMMPLLAYNYASGDQKRRRDIFRIGTTIAVIFASVCVALYEIFAPFFVALFIQDSETVRYAAGFLRIMVIAMPLMAYCYPMIIQFQAMKRNKEAIACSLLRKGILDIPLLFLLDRAFPLYGCMFVQPIIDFSALVLSTFLYLRILKLEKKQAGGR